MAEEGLSSSPEVRPAMGFGAKRESPCNLATPRHELMWTQHDREVSGRRSHPDHTLPPFPPASRGFCSKLAMVPLALGLIN